MQINEYLFMRVLELIISFLEDKIQIINLAKALFILFYFITVYKYFIISKCLMRIHSYQTYLFYIKVSIPISYRGILSLSRYLRSTNFV